MAKNISILEGRKSRNFSQTKKLRTNLVGSGTQDWVPEDEAGDYCDFESIEITENGIYMPQGHGYKEAVVNVKNGADDFIAKTIIKNGTYKPADDGVAGYSSVDVKVTGVGADYTFNVKNKTMSLVPDSITELNGEIYGGHSSNRSVVKWNGNSFDSIASGKSSWVKTAAVNGTLYITVASLGNSPHLQVYNGSSFTDVPNSQLTDLEHPLGQMTSYEFIGYNNDLLILGGHTFLGSGRDIQEVYAWNGSSWRIWGELPAAGSVSAVIYKERLHIFYNINERHPLAGNVYAWTGSSWEQLPSMPVWRNAGQQASGVLDGIPFVLKVGDEERVHIYSAFYGNHYSFNGKFWRPEESLLGDNPSVIWQYEDKIYANRFELEPIIAGEVENE